MRYKYGNTTLTPTKLFLYLPNSFSYSLYIHLEHYSVHSPTTHDAARTLLYDDASRPWARFRAEEQCDHPLTDWMVL